MTDDTLQQPESVPTHDSDSPTLRHPLRGALIGVVLYLGFFTAITLFNSLAAENDLRMPAAVWIGMALLTTVGYLAVLVYTVRALCAVRLRARMEGLLLAASLALFLGLNPMVWEVVSLLLQGQSLSQVMAVVARPQMSPFAQVVVPFFLILTGVFGGRLLSRIVREAAMLVPVALVSALIDFWGVYWGFVSKMSESAPEAVSHMASASSAYAAVPDDVVAQVPASLSFLVNLTPPQQIGIGDFVFLAFFIGCALRLGFSVRRTVWGLFLGLLLASVIFSLHGTEWGGFKISISYLPGLVFICGGVLLANLRTWKLTRQEWGMTGLLVLVLLGGIGYSIAKAEMAKPRVRVETFTLPASDPAEAVAAAMARSGADLTLVVVQGQFAATEDGPALRAWSYLGLERGEGRSLRGIREHAVMAVPGEDGWVVQLRTTSPPEAIFDLLHRRNPKSEVDDLTLLQRAPGLTPAQLAVLDAPAQLGALPAGKGFILNLGPEKITLFGEKGQQVEVRYPDGGE